MKKFAAPKDRKTVFAQCKAAGVKVNNIPYKKGSDFTYLTGGGAYVAWSSWNGKFFGKTDKGVEFHSDSAKHDKEPWMQALLSFFYVEKASA